MHRIVEVQDVNVVVVEEYKSIRNGISGIRMEILKLDVDLYTVWNELNLAHGLNQKIIKRNQTYYII